MKSSDEDIMKMFDSHILPYMREVRGRCDRLAQGHNDPDIALELMKYTAVVSIRTSYDIFAAMQGDSASSYIQFVEAFTTSLHKAVFEWQKRDDMLKSILKMAGNADEQG